MDDLAGVAAFVEREWAEVVRIMTLAEGHAFESELSDDLMLAVRPAADGRSIVLFRFSDVLYAREPTTGYVVETRRDGRTRVFDTAGAELESFTASCGPPEWN